jgi:hypothetical protein
MKRVVLLVTISILAIGSSALVVADQFSALRLKAPKSCIEACGQEPKSGDYEAQVDYQMCVADCHPKIDFLHQSTDDLQTQIDALEARVEALEQQQPGQCTEGETRSCYTGPPGTEGIGICTAGSQICQEGEWGPCSGEIIPTIEICGNGMDDDCDGSTDEGCVCTEGEARSCYTGPPGTEGVGICTAGSQTCQEGEWGPCSGEITPTEEICGNGMDDDCDGLTDEEC